MFTAAPFVMTVYRKTSTLSHSPALVLGACVFLSDRVAALRKVCCTWCNFEQNSDTYRTKGLKVEPVLNSHTLRKSRKHAVLK